MNPTVLIPQDIAEPGKQFLRDQGYNLRIGAPIDEASLCQEIADCDAILVRTAKMTRTVMEAGRQLKVVAQHGVGVDNVDVSAATELGIWVTNAPLSNAETVAEHALGSLIALSRHVLHHDQELRRGNFEIRNQKRGSDLSGKTLGIFGLGRIGSHLARKAALGLDMKVVAFARSPRPVPDWVELVFDREEVFRRADFLSLHLPSSPETYHSIGERELGWMKPSAYLINTGRGEVVEENALTAALREGRLAGAAIDVFEQEPPRQDNPLFDLNNVILTPHSAALTIEAMERMALHAAMGIHGVLCGQGPDWPVNSPHHPRELIHA